jgi:hypothetical protein
MILINGKDSNTEDLKDFIKDINNIDKKKEPLTHRYRIEKQKKLLIYGLSRKQSKNILAINLGINSTQLKAIIRKYDLMHLAGYLKWYK